MADENQDQPDPLRLPGQPLLPRRRQQPPGRSKPDSGSDRRFSHSGSYEDEDDPAQDSASNAVPLRERRFSRSGTINGEERLNELLTGSPASPASTMPLLEREDESLEAAPPTRLAGRVAPRRAPAISAALHRRKLLTVIAASQVFGVTLLVLGFVVGWLIFSDRPAGVAGSEPITPAPGKAGKAEPGMAGDYALQAADKAIKAQISGDFARADQLFTDMKNQEMVLPGLNYRLGLLALVHLDFEEVRLRLNRSIREGEDVVASQYALASIDGSKGDFTAAAAYFDAATHYAPFHALPIFCWAECLRRDGKAQASLLKFDEALDRPLLESDKAYIRFKRDLTRIESGNDVDLRKEIADNLTKPDASGDTYLLAAAIDIQQGTMPAAADHLTQAAKVLPPEEFALKIADYFYQAQAPRPGLGAIMARRRSIPRADPAAWGIKESDPATWPPPTVTLH